MKRKGELMFTLVVIDYKSAEKTIHYINSFFKNIDKTIVCHVIIVDNSVEHLFKKELLKRNIFLNPLVLKCNYPMMDAAYRFTINNLELILVESKTNSGYAKGNNLGALVSRELYNDKYFIFSNNDLLFNKKLDLKAILEIFISDDKIAVIGPKISDLQGVQQSPNKKINIWQALILRYPSMLLGNFLKRWISDVDCSIQNGYVYRVMGSFLFINAKKFFEIEMFDNNTFLYAEEMIISERLLKAEYRNYYYGEMEVLHCHNQTIKNAFSTLHNEKICFDSVLYYFREYRKSLSLEIKLAKWSFFMYRILFPVKDKLKNLYLSTKR